MGVYKRAGSPYWWIDYLAEGRRLRESTQTTSKRLAEQMLAARKADIARGRFKLADLRPGPVFRDFTTDYLEHVRGYKRSWKRDALSLRHLCEAFGPLRLADVTPFLVEKYKRDRKAEVSGASVNRELACLKHVFNTAIKWGAAESNPVKGVKLYPETPRERYLSPEEQDALLGACSASIRPVVLTALETGMRLGEILALTWVDVDFGRGLITVSRSKNDERRLIPMSQRLTEELRALKFRSGGEAVFTRRDGEPLRSVKTTFVTGCRRAGIEGLRFHDLRHTFASDLVMNGADIVTVKELLGHKTLAMTMRYAHVGSDHMRAAVEGLRARRDVTKLSQLPQVDLASSA